MELSIKELKKTFIGVGEVEGFKFTQISSCTDAYLYEVDQHGSIHYEVHKRRHTPLCIDFEKRLYSETEFKEVYPKAKDFGIWAWSCSTLRRAKVRYEALSLQEV
jgi:hypothetical protein